MLLQFNINNLKLKVEGVSEVAKELRIRIEDERKSLEDDDFQELLKSNSEL